MKVAAVQIQTSGDKEANLELAKQKIREAADTGARLIVLPEATSQAFSAGRLDTQAEELDGPFSTALKNLADSLGVVIIVGMFCPADSHVKDGKTIQRVYNTALITGAGLHEGYNKIHTYDAHSYAESETVKPGEDLTIVEIDGVKVGVAICYDVRFPEQFKELARRGAQVIALPASWADGDFKLEAWRTLTSARALDSVSYVVVADQSRPGGAEKAGQAEGPTGIGHSRIIDPEGRPLAEAGYADEIIYVDIDPENVVKARKNLPIIDA